VLDGVEIWRIGRKGFGELTGWLPNLVDLNQRLAAFLTNLVLFRLPCPYIVIGYPKPLMDLSSNCHHLSVEILPMISNPSNLLASHL
jgi:hypothetical protein